MDVKPFGRTGGFTLVELMVTIGILAFLALVCASTLMDTSSWLAHRRLRASARELATNLQYARMEAVKRNAFCAMTFNQPIGATTYSYVMYVDANRDLRYDAGETVLMRVTLPASNGIAFDSTQGGGDGLTFVNNPDNRPSVAFDPKGLPRGGTPPAFVGGSAFLRDGNGSAISVMVSNVGRVRVQ